MLLGTSWQLLSTRDWQLARAEAQLSIRRPGVGDAASLKNDLNGCKGRHNRTTAKGQTEQE